MGLGLGLGEGEGEGLRRTASLNCVTRQKLTLTLILTLTLTLNITPDIVNLPEEEEKEHLLLTPPFSFEVPSDRGVKKTTDKKYKNTKDYIQRTKDQKAKRSNIRVNFRSFCSISPERCHLYLQQGLVRILTPTPSSWWQAFAILA